MVFKEKVFPDLVTLLEDEDAEVRANAAGAIMNSAVTTQGECGRGAQPVLCGREGGGSQGLSQAMKCSTITIIIENIKANINQRKRKRWRKGKKKNRKERI